MNSKIRYLREQLKGLNLEGMIVSNPSNIRYLTNIEGAEGILLITRKENVFLTHTMFIETVNSILTINDEVIVMDIKDIHKDDYENFFLFCENVGFEESYVTYENYRILKQKYKANNLAETEKLIEKQRTIKDEEEIEYLKEACRLTDMCFSYLLTYIKQGMTEKQIALEIERFYKTNGAEDVSFPPIVAFGENSSIAHWVPSNRVLKTADPILIDMGCKYKGYCSDMTRTIFMGCILEEIKPVYDLVLKCQTIAINELRENASIKTITRFVENNYEFHKYRLIHNLGHGVGLDVHEMPHINIKDEGMLRENMVVAIEPAIYLMGKYGIRIEDTVHVTKNGGMVLTTSPKNYIVI